MSGTHGLSTFLDNAPELQLIIWRLGEGRARLETTGCRRHPWVLATPGYRRQHREHVLSGSERRGLDRTLGS